MPAVSTASRDRSTVECDALAFLEALEAREAVDERALRSFIFEVSAGRPQGVLDATDLKIRIDPPEEEAWPPRRIRRRRRRSPSRDGSAETTAAVDGTAAPIAEPTPASETPNSRGPTARRGPADGARLQPPRRAVSPRLRRARRRRQTLSANVAGMGFNCLLVVLLMSGKLPGVEPLHELLWATAPAVEEIDFTDVNFKAAAEDTPVDGERDTPEELVDPGMAAFGELETTAALSARGNDGLMAAGTICGELGAVFGESGAGLATFDTGLGEAPMAKFFGQEIAGRRIVFVLDNSGSMQGGRLETVIAELLRCVDSLREDQEFYVIFHSDMVYPLFYPDPVDRYLRPTPANKRALARWLETVELCLGDSVDEALAIAAMIEPDTVFLLSDGRIQSQKTLRYLLDSRARSFPIHTFAVGMGSSVAGRRNLADVAAANGGEFRESEIPDEMRDLAREKLRPYHSERPGPVWGRRVKPFRPRG
ncbi:MAG TPA: hypothetical protein VF175_03630 [Lacipirellula sp.]